MSSFVSETIQNAIRESLNDSMKFIENLVTEEKTHDNRTFLISMLTAVYRHVETASKDFEKYTKVSGFKGVIYICTENADGTVKEVKKGTFEDIVRLNNNNYEVL